MNIDIHTLTLVLGLTHLIQLFVLLQQYSSNTYRGIGWWLLWCIAETLGFGFAFIRVIPELNTFAIFMQNSLIVLGALFMYIGLVRFLGRKENKLVLITMSSIYVLAIFFFVYVNNNILIRSILFNSTLALVFFVTGISLFVYKLKCVKTSASFIASLFIVQGIFFSYRFISISLGTPVDNFFVQSFFNYSTFFDAIIIGLLWTFGFIIMLNQRLNSDAEEAREYFESIFNLSPDGTIISQLENGVIVNANQGFTDITGYSKNEAIGKSSLKLPIWGNPNDREKVVQELFANGNCTNYEASFTHKNGTKIIGLMTAKTITIKEEKLILSTTRDITQRKKVEEELVELKNNLEKLVNEKTKELKERIDELERFHDATVNREVRMNEMRDEIERLKGGSLKV